MGEGSTATLRPPASMAAAWARHRSRWRGHSPRSPRRAPARRRSPRLLPARSRSGAGSPPRPPRSTARPPGHRSPTAPAGAGRGGSATAGSRHRGRRRRECPAAAARVSSAAVRRRPWACTWRICSAASRRTSSRARLPCVRRARPATRLSGFRPGTGGAQSPPDRCRQLRGHDPVRPLASGSSWSSGARSSCRGGPGSRAEGDRHPVTGGR